MKAMILAAGMGTRLLPLTLNKPKALIEVNHKTLLEILINRLKHFGVTEVIINVHHYANQIITYLKEHKNFDIDIAISDESNQLLDTGGGLRKASWFFNDNESFLLHNVDIISDLDLNAMLTYHETKNALSTLAVRKRKSSRYLYFDSDMQLSGWGDQKTGEEIIVRQTDKMDYAFSGIHIINGRMLNLLRIENKFSIIDEYLRLATSQKIMGYEHTLSKWIDVGTPENVFKSGQQF